LKEQRARADGEREWCEHASGAAQVEDRRFDLRFIVRLNRSLERSDPCRERRNRPPSA
jgi:hypothetical protein